MQTKTILIAILAGLAIIAGAGAFYWYEYRPTQIRQECNNFSGFGSVNPEKNYQSCLLNHGLEK